MDLRHRHGVVTGAGSGIGRVRALQPGSRGADLLLVGRRPEPLEETAAMVREAGEHEIDTAARARRQLQQLNAADPLAVDAALAPRLAAMEDAVRHHRSI